MTLEEIEALAEEDRLEVFGLVDCAGDDAAPEGARTLVLLGPAEPGFWAHFTASPEFSNGGPDPLDRWSVRVITAFAEALGGSALFPFGGPPYAPFQRWAVESGRAWPSPVGLLVHDHAGLWVSYRGAVALPYEVEPAAPSAKPCATCRDQPCLTACPVGALSGAGYDLAACHVYLDGPGQSSCMVTGCAVRRACPASAGYGRTEAQSAYHMGAFHP